MSHDADIFDRVMMYVTNRSTAIDVGAHKGVWAEKMAPLFGRVYCFEPNILLCDRLRSWSSREFNNVCVYSSAILDFQGMGSLSCAKGYENKTRSHYVVRDDDGDISVDILDSFGIEGCGLLKIDVEGGELLSLRGASDILQRQKPIVVVEYKHINAKRFGWSLGDLYKYMSGFGYRRVLDVEPNLVFLMSKT